MKVKLSVIILVITLTGFSTPKSVLGQPYDKGIGIRVGVTNGISYKQFIGENAAFEGIVGVQYGELKVTGLYELHSEALDSELLNWYYGAGGHIGFYSDGYNPPYSNDNYNIAQPVIGLDGIFGLEYQIKRVPFTIGADIKPFIEFTEPHFYLRDVGLSVRYTF